MRYGIQGYWSYTSSTLGIAMRRGLIYCAAQVKGTSLWESEMFRTLQVLFLVLSSWVLGVTECQGHSTPGV